jgi:hypothetical protein
VGYAHEEFLYFIIFMIITYLNTHLVISSRTFLVSSASDSLVMGPS